MNYKFLTLILALSGAVFNFSNCADKVNAEEIQNTIFGQGSLGELVKEFKYVKEYAENADKLKEFDPNFKQFTEKVLKLFDNLNNEQLKKKITDVKGYREYLSQNDLYLKDKVDLSGPQAIQVYEDTLKNSVYNLLKTYFLNLAAFSKEVGGYPGGLTSPGNFSQMLQIMPIRIGDKELRLSDIFLESYNHLLYSIIDIQQYHRVNSDAAADVLALILGKNLDKSVFTYDGKKVTVLIYFALDYINELKRLGFPIKASNKKLYIANLIRSLLRLGADPNSKDGSGKSFADYVTQKNEKGELVSPMLNEIYQEHVQNIQKRKKELKSILEEGIPVPELRDLISQYVN